MALPVRESYTPYNGESPTVTLLGGLSEAFVPVLVKGDSGAARTVTAATLDGAPADFIQNLNSDDGRAISSAVLYWLNAKHPGAGPVTLDTTWSGTINNVQMGVLEYSAVDQSTPLSAIATNTEANQLDGATVSVTLAGQSGELALSWVAIADAAMADGNGSITASANLTSLSGADVFAGQSRLAVGEDAVVATASEDYDWIISQNGSTVIDSTVLGAFAIFGSAAPAGGNLHLINGGLINTGRINNGLVR